MLMVQIRRIFQESHGLYGSHRITAQLRSEGYRVSRARVARLMRRMGLSARRKKTFTVTTNSKHHYPVSPNLLARDFTSAEPGKVWVSDLTYIPTQQGWLYLTVIIDLYNRMVVGWAMSNGMSADETTQAALRAAWERFHPSPGLIFHSDRGVQYACHAFRNQLADYGMIQSMSRKGDCWDNAASESFFATLKKELVYRQKYKTRKQARQSVFEYVEIFYNRERKHSSLGYLSPDEFTKMNWNSKNVA
jgi:transposase InsO family protein